MAHSIGHPDLQKTLPDGKSDLNDEYKIIQTINRMQEYHVDQVIDCLRFYGPYLDDRAAQFGYPNGPLYLADLLVMEDSKINDTEKQIIKEVKDLRKIDEDISALGVRWRENKYCNLEEPPFPILDPVFRETFLRERKYHFKFGIITFEEVFFITDNTDWDIY